jgi:hypothetical protein
MGIERSQGTGSDDQQGIPCYDLFVLVVASYNLLGLAGTSISW